VLLHESLRFRARLTSLVGSTQSEKETVPDMSTTNLFVELLVIGVGCASWLALLAMAVLGCDPRFIKAYYRLQLPRCRRSSESIFLELSWIGLLTQLFTFSELNGGVLNIFRQKRNLSSSAGMC
jgi:hypothetical protein